MPDPRGLKDGARLHQKVRLKRREKKQLHKGDERPEDKVKLNTALTFSSWKQIIWRGWHFEFPCYWARKFGQGNFTLIKKMILSLEISHDITMTIPTQFNSWSAAHIPSPSKGLNIYPSISNSETGTRNNLALWAGKQTLWVRTNKRWEHRRVDPDFADAGFLLWMSK